jgi:hypothetical protein
VTEAQRAAQALNIELHLAEMHGSSDLESALRAVNDALCDALYVVSSRHTVLNIPRIVEFATANRLPLAGGGEPGLAQAAFSRSGRMRMTWRDAALTMWTK